MSPLLIDDSSSYFCLCCCLGSSHFLYQWELLDRGFDRASSFSFRKAADFVEARNFEFKKSETSGL